MGVGLQNFKRARAARRPLDIDHPRLAERDGEAEVVGKGGLDDFLLHFAVERYEDLLPLVVLAHVDQRVLLGYLAERDSQPVLLATDARHYDRLKRRRRELGASVSAVRPSDLVADPRPRQAPELPDLASAHRLALDRRSALEHGDVRHLAV